MNFNDEMTRRELLGIGAVTALSFPLWQLAAHAANPEDQQLTGTLPPSGARKKLDQELARAIKPRIIKVHEHVWVAVGYALANMVMIETASGRVIIDTTESPTVAKAIMKRFDEISPKPVRAIIYTHNHADHFRGTMACYKENIKVIAHHQFMSEVKLQESRGLSAGMRAVAMYALLLPPEQRYSMFFTFPEPIVVPLVWEQVSDTNLVWPNVTFADQYTFNLGGIKFELIHAPGETPDQIIVHIPEFHLVCCADNFYPSFPNLYTIRGTSPRPVLEWAKAQDTVIGLAPDILVPMHGLPLAGRERIREILSDYRDAIMCIHDLVMDAIKNNRPINETASAATLPDRLANKPYLQPYYGYIPYCVRAIYGNIMGWFDGDPLNLSPLTRKELGAEVLAISGSIDKVLFRAEQDVQSGRYQAALELCALVLTNEPDNKQARKLKIVALESLSRTTINAPTMNYYRICAAMEKQKLGT